MSKDFRKTTDELFTVISHAELAKALGCSVATIRQARMDASAKSHRKPPQGWEKVVAKLADSKAASMTRLAARLKSSE
ncbi:MAG: hypothetical protein ABI822_28755 [Bryobacteraceae bacterium]